MAFSIYATALLALFCVTVIDGQDLSKSEWYQGNVAWSPVGRFDSSITTLSPQTAIAFTAAAAPYGPYSSGTTITMTAFAGYFTLPNGPVSGTFRWNLRNSAGATPGPDVLTTATFNGIAASTSCADKVFDGPSTVPSVRIETSIPIPIALSPGTEYWIELVAPADYQAGFSVGATGKFCYWAYQRPTPEWATVPNNQPPMLFHAVTTVSPATTTLAQAYSGASTPNDVGRFTNIGSLIRTTLAMAKYLVIPSIAGATDYFVTGFGLYAKSSPPTFTGPWTGTTCRFALYMSSGGATPRPIYAPLAQGQWTATVTADLATMFSLSTGGSGLSAVRVTPGNYWLTISCDQDFPLAVSSTQLPYTTYVAARDQTCSPDMGLYSGQFSSIPTINPMNDRLFWAVIGTLPLAANTVNAAGPTIATGTAATSSTTALTSTTAATSAAAGAAVAAGSTIAAQGPSTTTSAALLASTSTAAVMAIAAGSTGLAGPSTTTLAVTTSTAASVAIAAGSTVTGGAAGASATTFTASTTTAARAAVLAGSIITSGAVGPTATSLAATTSTAAHAAVLAGTTLDQGAAGTTVTGTGAGGPAGSPAAGGPAGSTTTPPGGSKKKSGIKPWLIILIILIILLIIGIIILLAVICWCCKGFWTCFLETCCCCCCASDADYEVEINELHTPAK